MPSDVPPETPANVPDLDGLARLAGAIPGFDARAWDSIRMLQRIEGRKGYLTALHKAAMALYDLVREDPQVQDHIETGKKILLGGKEKIKLTALPRTATPQALLALEHILHSCAFIASSPLMRTKTGPERRNYIAVPLNRNEFVQGQTYGHLGYEAFRTMIYAMALATAPSNRPVESHKPWLDYVHPRISEKDGKRTRISPTRDFKTWMLQQGLIFPYHPNGGKRRKSKAETSLLWLTLKGKYDDDPEKTAKKALNRPLQGDEVILPVINDRLSALKIACPLLDYSAYERLYDFREGRPKSRLSGNKQLFRAFSGEDGRGGRLYGPWVQAVPSDLRRYLTINGNPTAELDYGSMQLVLMYAMHRLPVPDGDLYQIKGQDRDWMKTVLTASVGVATKNEALGALRKKLIEANLAREGRAEELYDAFWNYHRRVYPHGEGAEAMWGRLQYADSQIALRVLRYILEQGIPAIPIHDGFVVQAQHRERLRAAMKAAWQDFWPNTPITIKDSH